MALDYQTVLNAYTQLFPDGQAKLAAPGGGDEFNQWWGQLEQNQVTPEMLDALTKLMIAKPDQRAEFLKQGGDVKGFIDRMVDFWSGEGGHAAAQNINQFGPEMAVIDAAGYQINPDVAPTINPQGNVAGDQFIGETLWNQYLLPSIEQDRIDRERAGVITGDVDRSIDAALAANREITEGRMNTDQYLKQNPDVAAWAAEAVANGAYPDLDTAAKAHYASFGKNEGRPVFYIPRLQDEYKQTQTTVGELTKSAENAAAARLEALDQRKLEMTTALERMSADRSGSLDKETAQLREALGVLETERRAAQKGLSDARVRAANAEVTGINQALEGERDRIAARTAAQGFIGGSTMEDSALARAAISARQGAAQTMGGARILNATDDRSIGNEIAQGRFGITGRDATERRGIGDQLATGRFNLADALSQGRVGIADTKAGDIKTAENLGTTTRAGYFDNDFTRRMQAATNPITLNKSRLDLLGVPGAAGSANINRALNQLNWIVPNSGPAPVATPTMTTSDQTGAGWGALGAGTAGAGFSLLNAYLNKPTTPTSTFGGALIPPPAPTAANTNRYLTPGLT